MKIEALRLLAYGPFTNTTLEFRGPELQIVYGNNEAGKSTALRAIRGLLFGIPVFTGDDHLHRKEDLRVGAVLRDRRGRELDVVRRKGRKDTLKTGRGEPVSEAELLAFLQGVDEPLFSVLFGLDHEKLRAGAEALLAGRGDLGEGLFAAGSGGAQVRSVLAELWREADGLFSPRARNKTINVLFDQVRQLKKRIANEVTEPRAFLEQQTALTAAVEELGALRTRHRTLDAERARLARLRAVLPWLTRRSEIDAELGALGVVPDLPLDARETRLRAQREADIARAEMRRLEEEIARLETRRSRERPNLALLRVADQWLSSIEERLGRERAAFADRPKLESKLRALEGDLSVAAEALFGSFDLGRLEQLPSRQRSVQRLRRLGQDHAELAVLVKQTLTRRQQLGRRAALLAERNQGSPLDLSGLDQALRRVRPALHLESRISEREAELAWREPQVLAGFQHLGLWSGSPEGLAALSAPTPDATFSLGARLRAAQEQERAAGGKLLESRRELSRVKAAIEALQAGGQVPQRAALGPLRERREERFRQIAEAALDRGGEPETVRSWIQEYELSSLRADRLADALAGDAERVARLGSLTAEVRAAEAAEQAAEEELGMAKQRTQAAETEWQQSWRAVGIEPLAPEAMRDWLERRRAWLGEFAGIEALRAELRTASEECRAARAKLAPYAERVLPQAASALGLTELWESLSAALQEAEAEQVRAAERIREAAELRAEDQALERVLTDAELRERELRAEYRHHLQELGLDPELHLLDLGPALDHLDQLAKLFDQRRQYRERIRGMDRDRAALHQQVRRLAQEFAPELEAGDPVEAAAEFVRACAAARRAAAEQEALKEEIERLQGLLVQERQVFERSQSRLASLLERAGVERPDQLERVEERALRVHGLRADREQVELQLRILGAGATVTELEGEAQGASDPDLQARLGEIAGELAELDTEIERTVVRIEGLKMGAERLAGSAAAAAEDLEALLARLREQCLCYIKANLAARILEREMSHYRDTQKGPILGRVSELFPRLTLGRYLGVFADFDADDRQVMVCERFDGTRARVSELSDATRDQLYLALRLATLERFATEHEPLPLVLDDVLIHFDDDRARGAIQTLAEYARVGQVLFFTHHARLVQIARDCLDPGMLAVSELPAPLTTRGEERV